MGKRAKNSIVKACDDMITNACPVVFETRQLFRWHCVEDVAYGTWYDILIRKLDRMLILGPVRTDTLQVLVCLTSAMECLLL